MALKIDIRDASEDDDKYNIGITIELQWLTIEEVNDTLQLIHQIYMGGLQVDDSVVSKCPMCHEELYYCDSCGCLYPVGYKETRNGITKCVSCWMTEDNNRDRNH